MDEIDEPCPFIGTLPSHVHHKHVISCASGMHACKGDRYDRNTGEKCILFMTKWRYDGETCYKTKRAYCKACVPDDVKS